MRRHVIAVTAAAVLAAPSFAVLPASANEEEAGPPPLIDEETVEMAKDGMEQVLRALQMMMEQIPRYGAPEMDEDGNIIIPRLDPGEDPKFEGEAQETAI